MDGCEVERAVVFGMPCCKKWCFYRPEQPLYYQDDNGPCYVYAYADQECHRASDPRRSRTAALPCLRGVILSADPRADGPRRALADGRRRMAGTRRHQARALRAVLRVLRPDRPGGHRAHLAHARKVSWHVAGHRRGKARVRQTSQQAAVPDMQPPCATPCAATRARSCAATTT